MLIVPLNAFPWVLNGILEAKVSLERIQGFLGVANRNLQAYYALGRPRLSPGGPPSAHRRFRVPARRDDVIKCSLCSVA